MPAQVKFTLGHRPELDGLRGIAILFVLLGHFFSLSNAAAGVELFFVLSGFLITVLLIEEFEEFGSVSLKNFYTRRALRLLPALFVVLSFCGILFQLGLLQFPITALVYIFTYTINFALAYDVLPSYPGSNPFSHMWSLSIEEQYYLLWPILFITLNRRFKPVQTLRTLLVLYLVWECYRLYQASFITTARRLYYGTDTHAQSLLAGSILAFIRKDRKIEVPKPGWDIFATICACMVLAFGAFFPISFDAYAATSPYWGLLFAMLLWLVSLPLPNLHRLLSIGWLCYLGRISYGLYLFHTPVLVVAEQLPYSHSLNMSAGLAFTIILATLSYRYIEKPILGLKKRFVRERARNKSDRSTTAQS